MDLKILKVSVPVLMLMVFQTGNCGLVGRLMRQSREQGWANMTPQQQIKARNDFLVAEGLWAPQPVPEQERARQEAEARSRIQELTNLGGNPSILGEFAVGARNQWDIPLYQAAINRADTEIARLKKEAEQRRQQEEARAKQEAEQRRQEEEARAIREAELLKQQEEERAKQAEEVQQRMRDLENLGGNPAILNKFANGTRSPEEIIKYRAALSRADAEIVRLRKESDLNKQSMINQLTEELESQKEENRELRNMIEQLMEEVKNLKMRK